MASPPTIPPPSTHLSLEKDYEAAGKTPPQYIGTPGTIHQLQEVG